MSICRYGLLPTYISFTKTASRLQKQIFDDKSGISLTNIQFSIYKVAFLLTNLHLGFQFSVVWKSKDGNIYSTKPSNIKVNLKFALSTIFRLKTVISQKDIWVALAVLHLVVDLFTNTTIKIDELAGLALLSVYRLQHADEEKLLKYAEEICPEEKHEMVQKDDFVLSLARLEEWGCIKREQGEYILNETVTSSMIKEIK